MFRIARAKAGINNLGVPAALFALLLGATLCGASASQAAPPVGWGGTGCLGYRTDGGDTSNIVCGGFGTPFRLTGYSRGGTSTLSYAVQCRKDTLIPGQGKVVMYPRVWYRKAQKVKGHFKVYGRKAAQNAAMKHCGYPKAPVLSVTLKPGMGATASLAIKRGGSLPWGK